MAMLYFAYGSNMDPEQMRERCPDHEVVGLAALHDHQIAFPHYSLHWSGGVAGAQPHHGDAVWGVLYEISEHDLATLDGIEGFRGPGDEHNVYDREPVTVELVRADDGSFPRRVRASAYFARPSKPTPPTREYLDRMLRGARHHHLPEEYVEMLTAIETLA